MLVNTYLLNFLNICCFVPPFFWEATTLSKTRTLKTYFTFDREQAAQRPYKSTSEQKSTLFWNTLFSVSRRTKSNLKCFSPNLWEQRRTLSRNSRPTSPFLSLPPPQRLAQINIWIISWTQESQICIEVFSINSHQYCKILRMQLPVI